MANIFEPTSEQIAAWDEWVRSRPEAVRKIAEKIYPWKLYRLKTSGHRVTLYSIDEQKDNTEPTLRVNVSGDFNFLSFERTVFGIKIDDLEECDLPGPDEKLGSMDLPIDVVKALL
jgi:hypothetical protein